MIVTFERYKEYQSQYEIGEQVYLWNRPGTDDVNIYCKGSVGGSGLMGFTINGKLARYLIAKVKYKAEIFDADADYFEIKVEFEELEKSDNAEPENTISEKGTAKNSTDLIIESLKRDREKKQRRNFIIIAIVIIIIMLAGQC